VIGDIARNLRFRLFDEPQIRKAREHVYDGVREGLQISVSALAALDTLGERRAYRTCLWAGVT